ncbi:heavy metal-responsive transcriptional regulator [Mastigocoleus sp. MO_188.B34]|uniref:heavy metal-responsive transcriptional regulator n=1 Tax=Mastigocoleus sp. MO_188.B34 TaxID=3036635 RepID=UPI002625257B|nr:heavy metal-responsive transcriptional regulator [Mastigocoleus sp. MO_188.B34]MDJ0694120.1 heavy metal-responsive transcriptional regulator [Mastigocoleus sp. MO_188.B34]
MKEETLFLIGQVQQITGIPIRTIRYYESLGLIRPLKRTEGGFRLFSAEVFKRLSFIKRAQSLGLSLQEISEILQVYDGGKPPCDDIQQKLKHKIEDINKQIDDLLELRGELQGLISDWHSVTTKPKEIICPNIQK